LSHRIDGGDAFVDTVGIVLAAIDVGGRSKATRVALLMAGTAKTERQTPFDRA